MKAETYGEEKEDHWPDEGLTNNFADFIFILG